MARRPLSRTAQTLFLLLFVLVLAGCGGGTSTSEEAGNFREIPAADPFVAQAREEAQRRWPELVSVYRSGEPGLSFVVKVALPTADGSREHIWVDVVSIDGDTIEGTLANDPVGDLGVTYGDPLTVDRSEVEDWLIYRDGERALGGFSIERPD